MLKESPKNVLKSNAASHNNTSWYTDMDGFLKHSSSGESLYYKGTALQKIILFFLGGGSPLYVSRKLSISSRLSNFLAYNYSQYFPIILCISVVLVVTSFLSFLILFIWVLTLFFLISLAKGLSILFIFSKNQLLFSLIPVLLRLYFAYFHSDLYYFLSSTHHGICCSFSSSFRCKIRLLI